MGRSLKLLAAFPATLACLCLAAENTPTAGVKTPGVQIPFAKLKAEAEFEGSPGWLLFSDSVLLPAASGEAIEKIDTKENKPGIAIDGFDKPCAGAITAFRSVWVPNCGAGTISRMDPKTGVIAHTIAAGADPVEGGIAASSDSVWVLTDAKTTLSRIDPDNNAVVAELRLPAGCGHLTFAANSLWLTCPSQDPAGVLSEDRLFRVNPATNLVEQRIEVSAHPGAIAFGDDSIWVLGLKEGKVDRIDPKTNKVVTTIELKAGASTGAMAFGEGNLWVSMPGFPVTRIDTTADKERVVQQFWGEGGGEIEVGAGSVWLSLESDAKLLRLDPRRIEATLAE